jgi:hypothetical protein
VEAQKALASVLSDIKGVDGVLGVERVVCGGCLDFKVVTTLPAEKFGAWEEKGFAPETDFIAKLEGIDGITMVETQTYTVRVCGLTVCFESLMSTINSYSRELLSSLENAHVTESFGMFTFNVGYQSIPSCKPDMTF